MRHVQPWHGSYRVRKPIPKALQAVVGRGQYLTRSLGTADPREADKRAPAVLAEFQAILELRQSRRISASPARYRPRHAGNGLQRRNMGPPYASVSCGGPRSP
jgi:hypothetical protein